jgi:hypothetical protein
MEMFPISADTFLYALWTPITYTVVYDGNTNTSGTAPVDPSSYVSGEMVTVLGTTLEKTGYTFANWNTVADGSGTYYFPMEMFPISADTFLYALWTPDG